MTLKNYIQFALITVQLLFVAWELHRMKKGTLTVAMSWTIAGIVCALGIVVFALAFVRVGM